MTATTQRILFDIKLRPRAAACGRYVFLYARSDISRGLRAMANKKGDDQSSAALALHAQRGQTP